MRPPGSAEVLARRRRLALSLLAQGMTLADVAEFVGCAPSSVLRWRDARRRRRQPPGPRARLRPDSVARAPAGASQGCQGARIRERAVDLAADRRVDRAPVRCALPPRSRSSPAPSAWMDATEARTTGDREGRARDRGVALARVATPAEKTPRTVARSWSSSMRPGCSSFRTCGARGPLAASGRSSAIDSDETASRSSVASRSARPRIACSSTTTSSRRASGSPRSARSCGRCCEPGVAPSSCSGIVARSTGARSSASSSRGTLACAPKRSPRTRRSSTRRRWRGRTPRHASRTVRPRVAGNSWPNWSSHSNNCDGPRWSYAHVFTRANSLGRNPALHSIRAEE